MLLYVDDCLCVSEHPRECLEKLNKYFPLKPGSGGDPKLYLGTKISKVTLPNGVEMWAMSTSQYVQEGIRNVALRKSTNSPLAGIYRPELDVSPELGPKEASCYASLIGMKYAVRYP